MITFQISDNIDTIIICLTSSTCPPSRRDRLYSSETAVISQYVLLVNDVKAFIHSSVLFFALFLPCAPCHQSHNSILGLRNVNCHVFDCGSELVEICDAPCFSPQRRGALLASSDVPRSGVSKSDLAARTPSLTSRGIFE